MFIQFKKLAYYMLPHHALSRLAGVISRSEVAWFKRLLVNWFIKKYGVDMSLAVEPNPDVYRSFNQFFTRAIHSERRPICPDRKAIASPADGVISQMGALRDGQLLQAKGIEYSLSELLGGDDSQAQSLLGGEFMTVYLSPKDYHRVHIPFAGQLEKMVYVPGRLFSVNAFSSENIPNLFTRNERVVCWFKTECGPMVVVLVGAMLVASVHTVWAGKVAPATVSGVVTEQFLEKKIQLNKGDELGHFELGSTVIVIFPRGVAQWSEHLKAGSAVQMGQQIGLASF